MSHLASKLKASKLELSDDLLVHLALIFILQNSVNLRSFITVKTRNGLLISHYVQDEDRLKQDKNESAHLVRTSRNKGKENIKEKRDDVPPKGPDATKHKYVEKLNGCFFRI